MSVLFTPHLAPMNRGMLATCYAAARRRHHHRRAARPVPAGATRASRSWWSPSGSPSTKASLGSNTAHVTVRADARTGWIVAIAAIDNLTKGASGQAVQCANILAGLPEPTGLSTTGVYP